MSLNFDLTKIENYKDTCYDDEGNMRPETRSLVFATMVIGLGSITTKNADEFWARLNLYERVAGTYLHGPDGDVRITPQEVQKHIGLATNVSNETRAQLAKRLITSNQGLVEDLRKGYHVWLKANGLATTSN